jgi:ribosomal protein S2
MDLQDPMCLSIVKECTKYQIPIIAITDTNTNPLGIEYPIPGNDAEYELYTQLF